MSELSQGYRRQQRRRAIIAWLTALLALGLVVVAAVFGEEEKRERVVLYPAGFEMTAAEYDSLESGLDQSEFFARLEQTGSPEVHTPANLVALFPPHEDDLTCSYWQISDRAATVARVCFDEDGKLVDKLERGIFDEPPVVSA